ncbi:MAG: hypothetical protein ACP5RX_01910 [Minisyncoccia bacterium]
MLRFIKYFLLFILLIILQIYFEGNIFLKPIIHLSLLFTVFSFFTLPFSLSLLFAIISGIVFDSFSNFSWGVYLFIFILIVLGGKLLTKIFEEKSFWSRLLIGEIMIISYFVILFVWGLLFAHLNLGWLVFINLLINSLLYLGVLILSNHSILYELKKKHH